MVRLEGSDCVRFTRLPGGATDPQHGFWCLGGSVIVTCSYEELNALRSGADGLLDPGPSAGAADTPNTTRVALEFLLTRISGDLSLSTLAEQMEAEHAVQVIVGHFRSEMELYVLSAHPAAEASVAAYFDFAHALTVLERIRVAGEEMRILVEVVTGTPADGGTIRTFVFPD